MPFFDDIYSSHWKLRKTGEMLDATQKLYVKFHNNHDGVDGVIFVENQLSSWQKSKEPDVSLTFTIMHGKDEVESAEPLSKKANTSLFMAKV